MLVLLFVTKISLYTYKYENSSYYRKPCDSICGSICMYKVLSNMNYQNAIFYFIFQVVEFNLSKREYTDFSEKLISNPPQELINRSFPINCITFDASRNDSMIFSDDNTICVLTKNEVIFSNSLTAVIFINYF